MVLYCPLLPSFSCIPLASFSLFSFNLSGAFGQELELNYPGKLPREGQEERDLRRGVCNDSFGVRKCPSFTPERKRAG